MSKKELFIALDGNDANPGTYKSPKRSPQVVSTSDLKSGDKVRYRQGDLFTPPPGTKDTTFVTVKLNGVTFDSYSTGTEKNINPGFSHAGSKSVAFGVLGNDNVFQHLDVWHAETGMAVYQTHTDNQIVDCRVQDFGDGIVNKGSNTLIQNCYLARGRMIKNTGAKTDHGARAIVLERIDKSLHSGTRILACFIEECMSPSLAFPPFDGAAVEFYGGVEDVRVEDCFVRRVKIMSEYGAVTSRRETVRNVVFARNMILAPLAYFNPAAEAFHVDVEGLRYERNTVVNDDIEKSLVFLSGGSWTDLSTKLAFHNNLMVSDVQLFNASAGVNLNSIVRSGNVYSGAEVGLPLINGDSIQEIPFVDSNGPNYHLTYGMQMPDGTPYVPGAWGVQSQFNGTAYKGGVATMRDLYAVTVLPGDAGRRCYVSQSKTTYEVQKDLKTWLKCD